MRKQSCKTLFVILTALLCLLLVSGVLLVNTFSQTDLPVATPDAAGTTLASNATVQSESEPDSTVPMLRCLHFTDKDFLRSVNETTTFHTNSNLVTDTVSDSGLTPRKPAKGGISPHHLLAGRMIADFFSTLALDSPETIVVIGPNHLMSGNNTIHTSTSSWGTPFGTLEADGELASKVIQEMKASENNALMEEDHSISALVPYIKYYLPDTKIVPIILHGNYTKEKSKELGTLLGKTAIERPNTLILASIDFSHYLDVLEADEMDVITLDAINSWDIDELSIMGDDNLDSPPSIITLLTAMETVGAKEIEVSGHSNSSKITKGGYDFTTSYFTMFFR